LTNLSFIDDIGVGEMDGSVPTLEVGGGKIRDFAIQADSEAAKAWPVPPALEFHVTQQNGVVGAIARRGYRG
jgi:hypothetical protein